MGKKKWYQTGEFEDGYQFGDIFRTVKNAVGKKKVEKQDKKETKKANTNKTNANFTSIDNGKLTLDSNARSYGFFNEAERQNYIKENPNLYAVMGGYKYEPNIVMKNYTPISENGKKIVAEAQEKDLYIKSLQYRSDKKDAFKAHEKRSKGMTLTDREIEAEVKMRWLEGGISSDDIYKNIEKAKAVNSAVTKFNNGEEINLGERLLLTENGGQNFTNGNTYKTIEFLVDDNTENILAFDDFKKAAQKDKEGQELTDEEKADISNYLARNEIKKSIVKDKYTLGNDIKENAENLNTLAAVQLYNDAIYKKGIDKTLSQMELYINTGMTKYLQDIINAGTIFFTENTYHSGLSDERASDVLKNIPKNKFEIANDAVAQNFTLNDKKLSKFVQDATVSISNNAIPMLLGGVSGGASLVTTGLSVFGSSYSEAVRIAPEAEEWQYWTYAGVNTAIEVCMEKLLSGDKNIFANSGSDFSEAMFKTLSKNISNKTLLKGAYILSNGTGETLEEGIQGLVSPVLQEIVLGVDSVSILSTDYNEQRLAVKNAIYDGLVGFASAGITTGLLGRNAIQSIEQKQTVGAYYKKAFNDLNVNIEDVAVYLKEISNGENTALQKAAEKVLNGDKSNEAVADMMINGFDESRNAQAFVYEKIGERLNKSNRYTVHSLIREYDKISKNGIPLSKSITEAYSELVNADEDISRERFNYLVGRLSMSMDSVLPRASVSNELVKRISGEKKENDLSRSSAALKDRKNVLTDENAFVEGLWDGAPNTNKNIVEKSQLESLENFDESGIIEETVDNDTGIPGEYTEKISWSIFPKLPVRKCGKGYFGKRIQQKNPRIDNYELKINPNNESYYLQHPDGRYVQFENMKNSTVQDAKLVKSNRSYYHVERLSGFMKSELARRANRQLETVNAAGYKLEWIVSDKTAVEQLTRFFAKQNMDIIVTYCPE